MALTEMRPTKRPRTRSVARREREEAPTLASVLLPVVQQGFLGHQELGQLSQMSRQLNKQCKEELWETLCLHRWPNTAQMTQRGLFLQGGYSGWYRRRTHSMPEQIEPPPLDPALMKPEHFVIMVDITRGGESLLSDTFTGTELQHLLEKGWIQFGLRHPVPLGKAGCFLQGACRCDARYRFNLIEDDLDVTMQLFRGDGTSCRIYQSMKRNPEYSDTEDGDLFMMSLGPGVPNEKLGLSLRWSPMAGYIHHRVRAAFAFDVFPIVSITEQQGEEVAAVTSIQIAFTKRGIGDHNWTPFEPNEEAEKHGVTLLHILQELQSVEL